MATDWVMREPPGDVLELLLQLESEGLDALAMNARSHLYDEWKSSVAFPLMQLYKDLHDAGRPDLAELVTEGKWDSTKAESDAWAASHDGRDTFALLTGQPRNRAERRRKGRHGR